MARTLDEIIGDLPAAQGREIEADASRLIKEELTLRDLRRTHALTQEPLADALNISQDGVSAAAGREG